MPKKIPRLWIYGLAIAAALGAVVGGLYWACQQSPPFYRQALAEDRSSAQQASDALLREAASLASSFRRPGRWQALFTAQQINGWLAHDMLRNHPHLLPSGISDLRVALESDQAQIAFRWRQAAWSAIVALQTEIYLRESNVIALRIRQARAGMLPLPLGGLLDELIVAVEELGLQIDQQQIDGDPLLLITVPAANDDGEKLVSLESLEISHGELYVAGRSQRRTAIPPLARQPKVRESLPEAAVEKTNVQR